MVDSSRPVSAFSIANVLLRHRRAMVATPICALAAVLAFVFLSPARFAAESAFMPQGSGGSSSRLSSLAEQFGVSFAVGAEAGAENPAVYVDLMKGREILVAAASSMYDFDPSNEEGPPRRGTLGDLFEVEGATPEERLRAVVRQLEEEVTVTADAVTGIVRVTTRAPWPELAVLINRRLLDLTSDFNLQTRQSQARAERQFVEGRLEEKRQELQRAEATLARFLEENRRYQDSPPLELEFRRLQRQVEMQQTVYVSLASAFEQAQIAEVRNTPVMTIIENPEGSQRRLRTSLITALALALVLGVGAGATLAFGLDYLRVQRELNPHDFAQFTRLGREAIPGLGGREIPREPAAAAVADRGAD